MWDNSCKGFHIWFRKPEDNLGDICFQDTLYDIEHALNKGLPVIHTYQVESVKTYLFDLGYRIFVHPFKGSDFELTLGNCSNTDREIRPAHNLCKLLISGAFDTPNTNVTGLEE